MIADDDGRALFQAPAGGREADASTRRGGDDYGLPAE
jgi:hypothetical protein